MDINLCATCDELARSMALAGSPEPLQLCEACHKRLTEQIDAERKAHSFKFGWPPPETEP